VRMPCSGSSPPVAESGASSTTVLPPRPVRCDERERLVMATPARWSEVGDVAVMREEVSASSDWSSASRRLSWVVAKEAMSTASLGAMAYVFTSGWVLSCEVDDVEEGRISQGLQLASPALLYR